MYHMTLSAKNIVVDMRDTDKSKEHRHKWQALDTIVSTPAAVPTW